jgi:hypothetical protein
VKSVKLTSSAGTIPHSAAASVVRPYKMASDPPSVAILWLNCYKDVWRTIAYDVSIDYRAIY